MTSIASILEGEGAAVARLAARDVDAWTTLVEHVFQHEGTDAPAALVLAMLAIDDDPDVWSRHAREALAQAESAYFTTVASAMRRVQPWLFGGIRDATPPDHRARLLLRFAELRSSPGEDALALLRVLVRELEAAGVSPARRAEAQLILARRALEDRSFDEARAAARAVAGLDPKRASEATRSEGAILLASGRVTEALEVLHEVLETRGPLFGGGGAWRFRAIDDPLEAVLDEAATIATWASHTTPEWVRALGGIAERSGRGWDRFERALARMIATSRHVDDDLEVVERHATQRGLTKTAKAARDARDALTA